MEVNEIHNACTCTTSVFNKYWFFRRKKNRGSLVPLPGVVYSDVSDLSWHLAGIMKVLNIVGVSQKQSNNLWLVKALT